MVQHYGFCPSLRKKVDFEVSEVIDYETSRGTKYQVKGTYDGRLCNTFCSATTAAELRNSVGSPKNFVVMAEENQSNLAQATQEENVPAIVGPSERAIGQDGEAAEALPLAETVPRPIITPTDMELQPIDNLSVNDINMGDMQITHDEAPTMDANFEIAEMQPEGDGSSIGNIAPMNPDAPLHAEEFDAEESQANLAQATQEENVPTIVGPSEMAIGQQGEAAEALPLAETVPRPIITPTDMELQPIDNLNLDLNGGDIISAMQTQFGEAPQMLADFSIAPMQPEGDGSSIGNIAPMNPDVPFASDDDDDDDDDDEMIPRCSICDATENEGVLMEIEELGGRTFCMSCTQRVDLFDAETLSSQEIEEMDEVAPAVCFVEKIPPEVWANTSLEEKLIYEETGDEAVLSCPQCGMSKANLRGLDGYCPTTDPEGADYISTNSCPYEKYFAPQHWVDSPQVIGHISENRIEFEETLPAQVDMPPINANFSGIQTRLIPSFLYNQIYYNLPDGVMAKETPLGFNHELTYYGMDEQAVNQLIDMNEGEYNFMYGSNQYSGNVVASTNGGFELQAESIVPYSAETFESEGMYGEMFDYPIVFADLSDDGRGYLIGFDDGEVWNTGILYGDIKSNIDFINEVGQKRMKKNTYYQSESFNADSNVLTLDEAFPSKSFETPVIEPHPDHENYYMICEDCGNPYEVEKLRFTGDGEWIASYSNHRPETNGMCDSLLDFEAETFDAVKQVIESKEAQVNDIMFGAEYDWRGWNEGGRNTVKKYQRFGWDIVKTEYLKHPEDSSKQSYYEVRKIMEDGTQFDEGITYTKDVFGEGYMWRGYEFSNLKTALSFIDDDIKKQKKEYGAETFGADTQLDFTFDEGNASWDEVKEIIERYTKEYSAYGVGWGEVSVIVHPYQGRNLEQIKTDLGDEIGDYIVYDDDDADFEAETFGAESKKNPNKPATTAEKAILTGASTGATMGIAEALLAAEEGRSFSLNYGPKRMYVVIEYNDGKELFMQDYKQFIEELNEAEATGDEELVESLFGVGSDYHNIAEDNFDMGGPNSTPYGAETFNADSSMKAYCKVCNKEHDWELGYGEDDCGLKCKDSECDGWYDNPEHEGYHIKAKHGASTFPACYFGAKCEKCETNPVAIVAYDDEPYHDEYCSQCWNTNNMAIEGAKQYYQSYNVIPAYAKEIKYMNRIAKKVLNSENMGAESDDDWADEGIDPTIVGYCYGCNTVKPNYGNCKCVDDSMTAESFDAEWNLDVEGGKGLTSDNIIVRRNDVPKGRLAVYPKGHDSVQVDVYEPEGSHLDSHLFEATDTNEKAPIKTLGILLGVGALAAYLAPQNLRDMFKR